MPFPTDTFLQFFRNSSNYVAQEFENFYAQLAGYLSKEHKEDGTHGAITATSVTMAQTTTQGTYGPIVLGPTAYLQARDTFVSLSDGDPAGAGGAGLPLYLRGGSVISKNLTMVPSLPGLTPGTDVGDVVLTSSLARFYESNFSEGMGHWTAYTPSWAAIGGTQPSIGDGTLTGAYTRIGNTIHYRVTMVAGGTTGFGSGGAWTFSLPVTSVSYDAETPLGTLSVYDSSTSTRAEGIVLAQSTAVVLPRQAGVVLTNAAPWAWASGDKAIIFGTYEAA